MKRAIKVSFLLIAFLIMLSFKSVSAETTSPPLAQTTPEPPGDLIFDQVAVFDQAWKEANSDGGYFHFEIPLPGPGIPTITGYGDRTGSGCEGYPDPCYCDSLGGYAFWVFDDNGEELPYYGDNWVPGGLLVIDAYPCMSSLGDVYDYETHLKVYFDPDPDGDKVPDSRDQCPGTPQGSEVDEDGCALVTETPPLTCQLKFSASPATIQPGQHSTLSLQASWSDNTPVSWATVNYDILDGPGMVGGGSSTTDANGQLVFEYQAPTDVKEDTSATIRVIVDGCQGTEATTTIAVSESPAEVIPDTTEPGTPQMTVYATPSYFQDLGDQVEVTITVTDADGAPRTGELVQLISLDPAGASVEANTDSAGVARFTLSHVSEQAAMYSYAVQAAGLERRFQIPVTKADIEIEQNPTSGEPFQGVVADGVSTLKILVDIPHLAGGEINFVSPQGGTLEGDAISFPGHLLLDNAGRAELTYRPPAYLDDKTKLTVQHTPHGKIGYPAWSMVEEIVFSFTNPSGQEESLPLTIHVFRPPVMLVHGFIGDKTTWANLAEYLVTEKFDPVVREYAREYTNSEDSSIQALSGLLQRYIKEQKQDYLNSNIKITKVDIVGHSMGGLISRNYIEEMPTYENDVRKLIMAATPNHGVSAWYRKASGPDLAEFYDRHRIASAQLHSDSEFILNLNHGEATGQHLNTNVEYANIIGRRTSLLGLPGLPYESDDGIVTTNSAHLNGVVEKTYDGTVHSTAIPLDIAVTEHGEIWGQIRAWLLDEIFRPSLQGSSMQIYRGEGDVSIQPITGAWQSVSSYPVQIQPWYGIRTGEGKATIALYLNDVLWGTVKLRQNTELLFDYASPELARVLLKSGGARFRSVTRDKSGHFDVFMGQEGEKWYQFQPRARVRGLDTDFVVQVGETVQTYVLEGQVGVESISSETGGFVQALSAQQGTTISASGEIETMASPPAPWWEDEFYDTSAIEQTSSEMQAAAGVLLFVGLGGLVVVVGLGVAVLFFARKRPVARWILIALGGIAVLLLFFSCVVGVMVFSESSTETPAEVVAPQPTTVPEQPQAATGFPTAEPTIPSVTVTPSPTTEEPEEVELTLINDIDQMVCYVFIDPAGAQDWGEDWLNDQETIPPGASRVFDLSPGKYDLLASDCDGEPLAEQYQADLSNSSRWQLSASRSSTTDLAELTVINYLDLDVCYVYIAPTSSNDWGEDWLGDTQVISPGSMQTFQVDSGKYDLLAADCEGNPLSEAYNVAISGAMDWEVVP